jgi:arylsulfatase
MRPETAIRTACCAWVLWLCAGCGGPPRGDIVLISVDTLRADHLSAYGYAGATTPQIDAFFSAGVRFENAYATSSYTTASMVSVLSGQLPQHHGVRLFDQLLPERVVLIPDRLPAEYQSAAFVSNGVLSDRGLGVAHRFDHFDDDMSRGGGSHRLERNAAVTTDAALTWLRERRDSGRPLFMWIHYMDPHAPYAPPEHAPVLEDPVQLPAVRAAHLHPKMDPAALVRAYDREIAYTDREIGRLLDGFAAVSDLERALVVLTADHGETLSERTVWFQHAYHVFDELVRVPLLLRGPGVDTGPRDDWVSGLDLAPTLLAFAGVAAPNLPGADLRGPDVSSRAAELYVESIGRVDGNQWRAVITPRGKWVLYIGPTAAPRILQRGYWDRESDPGEMRLGPWPDDSAPAQRLLKLVQSDPDPAGRPREYRQGELTAENEEILRMLGYIE